MNTLIKIATCTLALTAVGCAGMGFSPMPDRLSEERQRDMDAAWKHFVDIHPQIDHATMRDVILINQAWHSGVDELELRSVKRVGNMFVVMETHFDRLKPDDDAFNVMIIDEFANVHRTEKFTANELDEAVKSYLLASTLGTEEKLENETEENYQARLVGIREFNSRNEAAMAAFPIPEMTSEEQPPDPSGIFDNPE